MTRGRAAARGTRRADRDRGEVGSHSAAGRRLQVFARRHGRVVALQTVLLAGSFVLAGAVPERLVPRATPLAVKNLTVVPFTMI